ncbi:MAG TPA: MBL fold metallo-hydrolase, partial [Microthrixaceae bacterium]|nr:MBL fold metallo-hydrolase [Microthrixaceae bacterium]
LPPKSPDSSSLDGPPISPAPPLAPPEPPRHFPVEIAPETWVIQATQGEGQAPKAVHMNSMVIRGSEPIVVDTGLPSNRDRYLEDLFSIVEPDDVRWIFISHDDIDHYGNLSTLLTECPNATLVASWFLCQRLQTDGLEFDPSRWRWVDDGGSFTAGDRTLLAVRPPLYDSPTTRGLFDPKTGVYWASDCYATPVERGTEFVDQLDPDTWAEGFLAFQHWNSPWVSMLESDAFDMACRRVEQLRPSAIATAHGPTIEAGQIQRAFELLRAVPNSPAPPQPDQLVLDEIVAMAGAH